MVTRQRGAAASLLLFLVLLTGCHGSARSSSPVLPTPPIDGADTQTVPATPAVEPAEGSGSAARRQITELFSGEAGAVWDELEPTEQAIVSRSQFAQCAARTGLPVLQAVLLDSEYDTTVNVAAVPEQTGRSVTLDVRTAGGTLRQTVVEVAVAGRWRWVLSEQALGAYQAGECPSA